MPFGEGYRKEEFTKHPPVRIEDLADQGGVVCFLHNDIAYRGFLEPDPTPQGQEVYYKAVAFDAGTPTSFSGSTVVIPLTLRKVTIRESPPSS